jgi:hypothetical protein
MIFYRAGFGNDMEYPLQPVLNPEVLPRLKPRVNEVVLAAKAAASAAGAAAYICRRIGLRAFDFSLLTLQNG